jgi:succinoglycan biosynthesis transport protein ExoP
MQDRLKALSQQASIAERAVVDFKREHGIVSTGGRLIDEQQVSEMQSQLTLARSAKANAQAKLDRIREVLNTGELDLSVADALSNQVIISLRDSYVDLSKRAVDLESRLGREHEAPKRLRADMDQVRASIFDELKRIGEGYKSDLEIATSQEVAITADLAKAIAHSGDTSAAEVELAQLESDSEASRALYDTFLQRFGEVVQQQSFPLTETRLVTEASKPLKKSKPKSLLIMVGAIFVGCFVGFVVGWLRDKADDSLRTAYQAEHIVEAPLLASVPRLDRRTRQAAAREAIQKPLSVFAESIREIRVFLEIQRIERGVGIVGLTSAISGEGKSTIAANLASLMAKSKARILLIDADLRSRSLTLLIGAGDKGIAEVLQGTARLEDAVLLDQEGRFDFLPACASRGDSSDLLSSVEMKSLLSEAKTRYDMVLVDLPPILAVTDAKAIAPYVDGFLLVAGYGETSVEVLSEAVRSSGKIKDKIMGVVLNKADARGAGVHRNAYASNYLLPA